MLNSIQELSTLSNPNNMNLSMLRNQGMPNSEGPNSTQIEGLISIPQHRHMTSPNRTRVVDSKENENGVKEPLKQKRYRKLNSNKKTSVYRGVTKCRGRFECFVWDNIGGKKGKTVYVAGGFQDELEAARAHDLIAIKIWGKFAYTNFPESCYLKEISEMENMSKTECILAIRRKEGIFAPRKQIDGALSLPNERDNEECDASMSEEQNDCDLWVEHVTTFSPWCDLPHGIINSSTPNEVEIMEQNNAIDEFMLQEIGQRESQAPIGLQNEHESPCKDPFLNQFQAAYNQSWPHEFENDRSFENDLSLLFGPTFDYESVLFEDQTNPWESSMCQIGGENPIGAENGGVGSSGSCSIGLQSLEANIQQFDAPNTHELGTNTSSKDENMLVIDNDFDIIASGMLTNFGQSGG